MSVEGAGKARVTKLTRVSKVNDGIRDVTPASTLE